MVTEAGNVDAGNLTGLKDSHALGDFHRVPIHEHLDGVLRVREVYPSAGNGGPGRKIRGRGLGLGSFGLLELGLGDNGADEDVPRVLRIE